MVSPGYYYRHVSEEIPSELVSYRRKCFSIWNRESEKFFTTVYSTQLP